MACQIATKFLFFTFCYLRNVVKIVHVGFKILILQYISTHNNRNRNMSHSRGGQLVSEIGTGGHGGRNIIGDENQNWCSSKIPFHPHKTITSTIEPESQLNGII